MRKLIATMSVALLLAGCGEEAQKKAVVVDKWAEWEATPTPYGGAEVLAKIKEAKESGATMLSLLNMTRSQNEIYDISPLAGLTNLESLWFDKSEITDLSPLKGLTKLEGMRLSGHQIPEDQKAMLKKALPNCEIHF